MARLRKAPAGVMVPPYPRKRVVDLVLRKENVCDGCAALVDEYGRAAIGFCGPKCEMRRRRDERIRRQSYRVVNE